MRPEDFERHERTNKILTALIGDYLHEQPRSAEDFALAEATNRGLCLILKARQSWLNKKKERAA